MNSNNNKIWINPDPKAKSLIFLSAMMLTGVTIFFFTSAISQTNSQFNEFATDDAFVNTVIGIITGGKFVASILSLFLALVLWYVWFLSKMKKINIKNHPYLQKAYNLTLIPYSNQLKYNPLIVEKKFYYRDLPCREDLLLAYWISYQYKLLKSPQDFIGVVLLKLIMKNNITEVSKDNNYYLDVNKIIECEYEYEHMLLDILKEASNNGILKSDDFKSWFKNNYKKISDFYVYALQYEEEELIKKQKIVVKSDYSKVLGIEKRNRKIYSTEEINEIAKNMIGLKQFLLDFSLMDTRKILDVHLREYYLMYAKIFGITEEIKKEFEDIYPNFIDAFANLVLDIQSDEEGYINIS